LIHKRYAGEAEAAIERRAQRLRASMECRTCHGRGVVVKLNHNLREPAQSVPCPDCKPRGRK